MTQSITSLCNNGECRVFYIVMLNVIILNAVVLSVMVPGFKPPN